MKSISEINTKTPEGKLLSAALCMLTTTKEVNFMGGIITGTQTTPDEMIQKVSQLSEEMYKGENGK